MFGFIIASRYHMTADGQVEGTTTAANTGTVPPIVLHHSMYAQSNKQQWLGGLGWRLSLGEPGLNVPHWFNMLSHGTRHAWMFVCARFLCWSHYFAGYIFPIFL